MNLYTAERLVLDRHQAMLRDAELRARLLGSRPRSRAPAWVARRLRDMADWLDGGRILEPRRPVA